MKNKKPIIFMSLLVIVFMTLGATLAYFTTTDTYNNEFYASEYDVETQESFVSPDNWKPGDTTPKTVIATNHGDIPIAVRVKLTPRWEDKNGDPLPLVDNDDNEYAVINFSNNYSNNWVYQDGYYYYKRALDTDQSTTSLLKSVTFNMDAEMDNDTDCETVDGVTTCMTRFSDYSGGKYILQIEIETCQYEGYEEIWGTTVEIKEPIEAYGELIMNYSNSSVTFGKSISRDSFESITTVNEINIPGTAIDSWDCSEDHNELVMCWYTDSDNDSEYELYIGQEDGVIAHRDSTYAFSYFTNAHTIDLTNYDTSYVLNMAYMFINSGQEATTFSIIGLNNFDTSNVVSMTCMFGGVGYSATTWSIGDLSSWDVSQVTDMRDMFSSAGYNATTFNIGNLRNWNTSSVTDMSGMFSDSGNEASTWYIGDLGKWDVSSVTTMNSMFEDAGYSATTWGIGKLNNWDTSQVTDMGYMFDSAGEDSTTWNSIGTLKIYATNIQNMFYDCTSANAALNIYSTPTTYTNTFYNAATSQGSGIRVNYSNSIAYPIVATKSSNSNVVIGTFFN